MRALALSLFDQKPPRKDELAGLAIAAHGLLYVALLPVITALFAVLRAAEMPHSPFWFFLLPPACS